MSTARILKWISGGLEGILAIPVLGGLIVVTNSYTPLVVMLVLHIITLVISIRAQVNKYGSIMGIITSCLAWIPILGWFLHILAAILLMIDAVKNDSKTVQIS
ncbi:hypothetical protein JOD24_003129 [Kroppenstedtia sanguinis]|uniref:DUF4233 domain-containing protein n=1 Tax=Kroppenstedtia sanguinis TaxID=1380684 RepID=A0ABW4CEC5_9BACL